MMTSPEHDHVVQDSLNAPESLVSHPDHEHPIVLWYNICGVERGTLTTLRPEMITQMIRKPFFCVTDVRAIGKLIPKQLMCVIGAFTENSTKYLYEGARITQNNSCQKAPCNRCPV